MDIDTLINSSNTQVQYINILDENSSNIIIMTKELQYMKNYVAEKKELKNVISQQSNEIGRLLGELEILKTKYEEVFQQIV